MSSNSFDPSNETSLDKPIFVLRDSLGYLAVQILSARDDFSELKYSDMLIELKEIIEDLHNEYDRFCREHSFD